MTHGSGMNLSLKALQEGYEKAQLTPSAVVEHLLPRLSAAESTGVWTYPLAAKDLYQRAAELEQISPEERQNFPLWGIPFSVKDCIDVAGLPTSCACKAFTYQAEFTNPAIQKILNAGAILIGKTNLDQFATGVVGVRTDFDIPPNPFNSAYIPGGSSSGAAVSVARGFVSFAIGTDTGGSGRVPAGFNNVVGLKPTRGLLSTRHMIPACRSIDCISIFAFTATEANQVLQIAKGYDPVNPFSRREESMTPQQPTYQAGDAFTFAVPSKDQRRFFGNKDIESLFDQAMETLSLMGGQCKEIDYQPFIQVNDLLFKGSWLAERYGAIGQFIEADPDKVHPIIREVMLKARSMSASQVFEDQFQLGMIKQTLESLWQNIDIFVVPTTGTAYKIADVESDPIDLNYNLGFYTNFVNLLDLAAVAVPNGFQSNSVPCGITMIGPAFSDPKLVSLTHRFHQRRVKQLGATPYDLSSAL